MKRFLAIVLCGVFLLSLVACGGKTVDNTKPTEETVKKNEKKNEIEMELGSPNTVEDYAEFELFKIITAKKITASISGDIYYENKNSGETYVDIVLDWKNISENTQSSEEIAVASAISSNGQEYNNCLYAVETNNASYLSQYEKIASLSAVRLHCAISVPESEEELLLKLTVKDKTYKYNYSVGKNVNNAKEIKEGEMIEAEDYATLVFNGFEYTDDLLPSNVNGSYSHYKIDSPSNTYLVVKYDITNYMSTKKDIDSFVGVKAMYMDKYIYTGHVVVEDDDGKGFSSYEDIAPLTTRHFYYLIEVPKTVIENEVLLTISFNNQEFTFKG